jgi:hypothetical protein
MPDLPFNFLEYPSELPSQDVTEESPPSEPAGATISLPFVERANSIYWEVGYSMTTVWDMGLRGAPLAGPAAATTVFWRQHGVCATRVCTWVVGCLGEIPECPHWDLQDSGNSVLLSKHISAAVPSQTADGTELFYLVGQYVWGLQKAPEDGDPVPVPNSLLRAPTHRTISPETFLKHLIGPVATPTGYSGTTITY